MRCRTAASHHIFMQITRLGFTGYILHLRAFYALIAHPAYTHIPFTLYSPGGMDAFTFI